MTFHEAWRVQATPTFDPEKTQRLMVGAMMPLWAPMAAAAATAAAFWGLSRWMRLAAPEAVLEVGADAAPAVPATAEPAEALPETELLAAPAVEPPPVEATLRPVQGAETAVAAAMETVETEAPKIAEAVAAPTVEAATVAPKKASAGPKAPRKRPPAS